MEKNYYDILGVKKDATTDEIRRAFKKLSVKYHPDKHINSSESEKHEAEEKFKEINEAYETLSDEQKRQEYDNPMSNFSGFGGFGDFIDPFSFFGRNQHNNQRFVRPGQDISIGVNLNIADFYKGGSKTFKYKKNIRCGHCNGEGGETRVCTTCHGTGTVEHRQQQGNMISISTSPCHTCNGTGKIVTNKCGHCNGSGFKQDEKEFILNIDDLSPSMNSGNYVIDNYGGHESKDAGGPDGKLIGRIKIDLDKYKVDSVNNVFEEVEVPYYDMILGTDVELTLPNDKKIKITIPEESRDKQLVKSKGNGINGGDFYLCIKSKIPHMKKNDKELLKKIRKNHN